MNILSYGYFVLLVKHSQFHSIIEKVEWLLSMFNLQYWRLITSSLKSNLFVDCFWLKPTCVHRSSSHQVSPNSTGIYLFHFVFGSWPCHTWLWLIHCFLTQASLLYHILSRLHQRHYNSNFANHILVSLKLHRYKSYF